VQTQTSALFVKGGSSKDSMSNASIIFNKKHSCILFCFSRPLVTRLRVNLVTKSYCVHVWQCRGNMVDAFRMHIMQTKELGTCPVRQIGGCSFLYMRISNVYIVIVVSSNANVSCAFKFVVEVCTFCRLINTPE
jgi:hypothetical protein